MTCFYLNNMFWPVFKQFQTNASSIVGSNNMQLGLRNFDVIFQGNDVSRILIINWS